MKIALFLNYNFFDLCLNTNYKFINGPFANKIFKIIKIQKDKINIMLSGIKMTINKKIVFIPHNIKKQNV